MLKSGKKAVVAGNPRTNSAIRAAKFSHGWANASLKETIQKFAPKAKGILNAKGTKMLYKNSETGNQVVHDIESNYFRVENTNISSRNRYLDLDGTIPNNKTINGKTSGRSPDEYKLVTHFNNND